MLAGVAKTPGQPLSSLLSSVRWRVGKLGALVGCGAIFAREIAARVKRGLTVADRLCLQRFLVLAWWINRFTIQLSIAVGKKY